ncbi:hypothetical protein [Capnocytophaga canis]|uniref:hypothetical protein n=1 Tax=Capnocytophaga canis TaxID=1848903 RepID=UPI00156266AE|nr:hypothetical protein [Capnocytophaga canis]
MPTPIRIFSVVKNSFFVWEGVFTPGGGATTEGGGATTPGGGATTDGVDVVVLRLPVSFII